MLGIEMETTWHICLIILWTLIEKKEIANPWWEKFMTIYALKWSLALTESDCRQFWVKNTPDGPEMVLPGIACTWWLACQICCCAKFG